MTPVVTEVYYLRADDDQRQTGLLGWVTFLLDGRYKVEGVTVRRTNKGRTTLSYPFREDVWGRQWSFIHPIDDPTRLAIERQVLARLDLSGEAVR
jgi:hypothetical protein